jgi:hypothetical protein
MPKPKKNDEKQEFVSRCIGELTGREKERFPKASQRAAICYSQWGETPAEKEKAMKKKKKPSTAKSKDE